jgi:magnesium chelatase family protein
MYSVFFSAAINGIDGLIVNVESSSVGSPQPRLDIIGFPIRLSRKPPGVSEARREAVPSPQKGMLTVNLAPADIRKEGSSYDLPILLSLIDHPAFTRLDFSKKCFVGELSLSGELRPVSGALPMAIAARDAGFTEIFLPAENALEASAAIGIKAYPVQNASRCSTTCWGGSRLCLSIFRKRTFSKRHKPVCWIMPM